MTGPGAITVRADAQRNRQRLLAAALRAFSSSEEKVTLEAIAKCAGVGIGTLYRHFPTREALVEAVYRNELEQLRVSAEDLLASRRPDVALRTWMDRFADYVAAKRGMAEALRAVVASGAISSSETRDVLTAAIRSLLDAAVVAGTVRFDVRADDVLASLTGVFLAAGAPQQRDQAGRMLDLLMDGLRARTG
ncbi:MAG: TetR/AcrR family transcriptional regulator [Pseudonocardiales bacterium]|nr:TetR/AcrR family transcriptional regulator [Pseudonocardiales bacterium]